MCNLGRDILVLQRIVSLGPAAVPFAGYIPKLEYLDFAGDRRGGRTGW